MAKAPTSWSYSRYSEHDRCAASYKYKYIDKLPEPESPALERGSEVHKTLAQYVRGDIPRMNPYDTAPVPGWTYFGRLLDQLRDMDPLVEQDWGFTDSWKPTGWFAKDTWLRTKLDAALIYEDGTADVVDYKTGKKRPEHAKQAELYAISVMCRYAQVHSVTVRYWYIDSGEEAVFRFSRTSLKELLAKWTERAERMLRDKLLAPNPGIHCRWCPFSASKGGPCKY